MIVLLTDFGLKDPFVAVMKGVIATISPSAAILDLTHDISPQDVSEASFILKGSYLYFPKGTIFVVVVDPGVGTKRKIIYVETENYRFLSPDNGILTSLFPEEKPVKIIEVKNSKYFLKPVSFTFHGRDIFAPAAAYLNQGVAPEEMGPSLAPESLADSPLPFPHQDPQGNWHGEIVYIDRFGNLTTNLNGCCVDSGENAEIIFKNEVLKGLRQAYANSDSPSGPFAILNSFHSIEIAVNQGSAQKILHAKKGEEVILRCPTSFS